MRLNRLFLKGVRAVYQKTGFLGQKRKSVKTMACVSGNLGRKWPHEIGYAGVSNLDQNPALQIAALKRTGCKRIFTDTASGASRKRPQLEAWASARSDTGLPVSAAHVIEHWAYCQHDRRRRESS